jgi:CO dehydrogenase/acetyl-CoA synthase epsilon subunit
MVGSANTKETNNKVVEKLAAKYKIKVIGEPNITHNYENHTIQLSQTHYIHQISKEFHMENVNTVLMPMGPNMIQHESNVRLAIKEQTEYQM